MLLYYSIVTLHVIVCVILVLVVLLQTGRGADLSGAFGGAATQTAFGSRGPASFLSKMTTVAAIIFMMTCISLAIVSTKTESKSILETGKQTAKPAQQAPAAQPVAPVPTPEQIQRKVEELEKSRQNQQAAPAQATPNPAESQKPASQNSSGQKP